ncbi:MAG: GNAT family N-acetyltransferase [Saprospiraceae bacterium]|nr:GNAT family N-acetyltransferase [Saprospiraceae bacterium]
MGSLAPATGSKQSGPQSIQLSLPGFSCEWTDSAAALPEAWQSAAPENDLFLQLPYLEMLSEAPPAGMSFQYLLFRYQGEPVGVALCQLLDFNAREHIQSTRMPAQGLWARWKNRLRTAIASRVHIRALICGNLLLTGRHGSAFAEDIATPHALQLLEEAITALCSHLDAQGKRIDGLMIKDMPPQPLADAFWKQRGCVLAPFQPNMVMDIDPHWHTFDDYLDAMSSKYRVRARRAFKAVNGLELRELDADFLQENEALIHELYRHISSKAEFNMVQLHPRYFQQLASAFPHRFSAKGYFRGEELLGFFTTVLNGEELEAHFLGLSDDANTHHQLYLNMLYDIVKQGIELGAKRVVFSRTAMEIKSSVGATPQYLHSFLRHRCWWGNLILPFMVRFLEPPVKWTARHPFREGERG